MIKPIGIIAGEPNSISSEVIFKSWILRKKNTYKPLIVIGSFHLLNLQRKKLKYRIKLRKVRDSFLVSKHNKHELMVYDVKYMQRLPFQKISNRSNKYIFNCFDIAINLLKNKRILGLINCPIAKESLFKNKHQGITEFLSKKMGKHEKETMLIYNKKLSVSPLTTHILLKDVSNKIKKSKILNNVNLINNFFKRNFNKKPNIGILGLNPHNYSFMKKIDESKIILSAIRTIKKSKIKVMGPISPDTSFMFFKKYKLDVIIGMYHDQVLTPFKTLFKYDAINITLGLPCIRVTPDHGVAENIMGKKIANPKSLVECIKFFNHIK